MNRKMADPDPHVVQRTLHILDYSVKYCGNLVRYEVATSSFMDQLKVQIKKTRFWNVKNTFLRVIQGWAFEFRNDPTCSVILNTVNFLKEEGYVFPPMEENELDFEPNTNSSREDNCCLRCRKRLSQERELHCESCGQIFCIRCIVKTNALPELGDLELMVCTSCRDKMTMLPLPNKIRESQGQQNPEVDSTDCLSQVNSYETISMDLLLSQSIDIEEQEELELAIALSQSEAELKEQNEEPEPIPGTSRESFFAEPSECSVCCDRQVDSIIYLCGHICMCYECSHEQWRGKGNGCCPLCRTAICYVKRINPPSLNRM